MTAVLALDVAGTLISNTLTDFPVARPGLYQFLEFCEKLPVKVVLFTGLSQKHTVSIVDDLVEQGDAPPCLKDFGVVIWNGGMKDLRFASDDPTQVWIIDDSPGVILPQQKGQWLPIIRFNHVRSNQDDEFGRLQSILQEKFQ